MTETWWDRSHDWGAANNGYKLFRRERQGMAKGLFSMRLFSMSRDGWSMKSCLWRITMSRWSRSLPPGARNCKLPVFCHHRNLYFPTWYAQTLPAPPVGILVSWNYKVSEKIQWTSYHFWWCTVCWPPPTSPSAGDTYPQPVHLLQARRSSPSALASVRGATHTCSPGTAGLHYSSLSSLLFEAFHVTEKII